ncbi:MAG: ABC transporter ATP-binding protein [Calditrichia bacterium]
MNALDVEQIVKRYDKFTAVDKISFHITEGSMFGLLGPNGAGKSTTMRMIMNIIRPDEGAIRLFGEGFRENSKNIVGYLPEERGLYQKMKIIDVLQFLGEMKGLSSSDAKSRSLNWLERFGMSDRADRKVEELSKGLQQNVQFISTVLHRPKLLIVDEPFSGLDPVNSQFLKDTLLQLKKEGTTIILSTHLMDQAERLCDTICLINGGKIVVSGELSGIKRAHSSNSVVLEYSGDGDFIKSLPYVAGIDNYGNYMEVHLSGDSKPQQLFKELAQSPLEISRFEAAETSLNEIFIKLVGGKRS